VRPLAAFLASRRFKETLISNFADAIKNQQIIAVLSICIFIITFLHLCLFFCAALFDYLFRDW
jgi:hypothetical protein